MALFGRQQPRRAVPMQVTRQRLARQQPTAQQELSCVECTGTTSIEVGTTEHIDVLMGTGHHVDARRSHVRRP